MLEIGDAVGFEAAVEETVTLLRDPLLNLWKDQGMAPIEPNRGAMI
jgi:hypothetical protein